METVRKFELVVPAYNEAKNLQMLISRTVEAAQKSGMSSKDFNLLVVNNGSADDSEFVLNELKKTDLADWFSIVKVPINQGYGFGILSGLKASQAPLVGWSHADLQCDPANAFTAMKIVSESIPGNVLVKGTRTGRNWKDIVVSRVFETIARVVLGLNVHEVNAQPKVFKRDLLKFLENPPKTFAFDLYVLYCAKKHQYEIKTIPVNFPPRIHGVSNWASSFLGRYKTILGMIRYILHLAKTEGRL